MLIVYKGEIESHLSTGAVDSQVAQWEFTGQRISDAAAQTIASWWHSPSSRNSTLLSTKGIVTADMLLDDFVTALEYDTADATNQAALDALEDYIASCKITAGMEPCASCKELAFLHNDLAMCEECL